MIQDLMTPKNITDKDHFPLTDVTIISPENCNCFEDLLTKREQIKLLQYVPIKTDPIHDLYNSLDKQILLNELLIAFKTSGGKILIQPNNFPYFLPSDCSQNLIWIKEGTTEYEILDAIKLYCLTNEISEDEIILFERPLNLNEKYRKGTFKFVRHIHFWYKNKKENDSITDRSQAEQVGEGI